MDRDPRGLAGESSLAQQQIKASYAGTNQISAPEIGLNSTIKELICTLQESERASLQILDSLGIGTPETNAKDAREPSSMREILSNLVYRLQTVNARLDRTIQHINS